MQAKNIIEVIVDVPTMQTDRPYDYSIPEDLKDLIQPGMRVQVPFGSRNVLGYVISDPKAATDFEGELKDITALLDDEPVLSPEMLALGKQIAAENFCFLVEAYHTMLPNLLKVDYDKYFLPTTSISYRDHAQYFSDFNEISWAEAEGKGYLADLIKLKKDNKVSIDYRVEDRKRYKTEKWVQPLMGFDQLEDELQNMRKTAKKQLALVEVLMELDGKKVSAKYFEEFDIHMATLKTGAEKGWLSLFDQPVNRDPYANIVIEKSEKLQLQPQQERAFAAVKTAMDAQKDEVFLLQGVTGSGKTEVYLQLIQEALDKGQEAILLVPEISLTPQMVNRLKGRFGDMVAVLHSQLSTGEHFDEWRKLKNGQAKIAVGARSSIFAPLHNIGLIILDEEHEATYKQSDNPRYHAREVAKWRANKHGCPVILGSATPSLESRARAQNGVYTLLEMPERSNHQALPPVELIDMREEFRHKNYYQFSRKLRDEMQATMDRGEQVALMLNRRGYANFMQCRDCGYTFQCPNCDVSLTYHYHNKQLQCHYCGYNAARPQTCPQCGQTHLREFGTGTEKVEQEINELFPNKTVVRMDMDTTRRKGSHERMLKQIADKKADILLGTQMIAKGLDFPNITLVGIINADTSLYLPDFRAAERTFQLLTQMSGRAGRGDLSGQVLIQTYNPDHYALTLAQHHDYDTFYQTEMRYRKLNQYSPYFYTVRFTVSHFDDHTAMATAAKVAHMLREANVAGTKIIGPAQSTISRVNNQYYYQLLYQHRGNQAIHQVLQAIQNRAQNWSKDKIYVSIDVDPMTFM
ncbi:primosomal protein N' [Aerococcus sp. 1KP-2016]|uniref:primosomal protein N' n=1 Tax=Aerococcus sp. 1KP-2016 TaxID=1981982 RepID=UPI000B98C39E|nr:primosomal protein N' [Aerococcus sp. 1KP-2016]OYQ65822.1 primosomal protein N' [Aerococcus sp. 1KP-2016]